MEFVLFLISDHFRVSPGKQKRRTLLYEHAFFLLFIFIFCAGICEEAGRHLPYLREDRCELLIFPGIFLPRVEEK